MAEFSFASVQMNRGWHRLLATCVAQRQEASSATRSLLRLRRTGCKQPPVNKERLRKALKMSDVAFELALRWIGYAIVMSFVVLYLLFALFGLGVIAMGFCSAEPGL